MEFGWIPRAHLPPRNHMLRRPVPPRSVVPSSPCTPSPYGQEVRGRAALAWCCADRDVVDSDRPISQSCAFGGSGTTGLDDQVRLGALQSSAQLLASASLRLRGTAAS
ncbi:uncharacterized protein LOC133913531 isoform X3 [Phragmites australis]|uniref:uncharacterized protein LOC133913531 isoform X3 n=1 Tax=Phragmites australis TaxID=29695 RepID=UPI002D76E675|nr:uncharacterized protein LOC133913531 isoform X3 [Phragmites australis]